MIRNAIPDYSSSPRRGTQSGSDVYQRELEVNYCKNFSCCGLNLNDLHALLQHYEEAHVRFEEDDDNGHPIPAAGFTDDEAWSTSSDSSPPMASTGASAGGIGRLQQLGNTFRTSVSGPSTSALASSPMASSTSAAHAAAAATAAALAASHHQQYPHKHTPLSLLNARRKNGGGVALADIYSEDLSGYDAAAAQDDALFAVSAFPNSVLKSASGAAQGKDAATKKRDLAAYSTSYDTHSPMAKKASGQQSLSQSKANGSMAKTGAAEAKVTTSSALPGTKGGESNNFNNINSISSSTLSGSALLRSAAQDDLLRTVTGYLEHAIQQGMLPNCGEVGSPTFLQAAEDLIRKREEIVSLMESIGRSNNTSNADKPYRCTVAGCDKAYKNPNGLKYHNQHGHCTQPGMSEDDKLNAKPYRCTFLDCGKCYKNLNGLKYHIEHSHPNLAAALHAHIPGFATLDGTNVSQAAIAAAAAIAAVQANPMMMAAANAIMASAANSNSNSNNNNNNNNNSNSSNSSNNNNNNNNNKSTTTRLSPPSDVTPDSSPNSSPVLAPQRSAATATKSVPTSTGPAMTAAANVPAPTTVPISAAPIIATVPQAQFQPSMMTAYRSSDSNLFTSDDTPMTSPVLSRATLPGRSALTIQTSTGALGMATPSSLSPTMPTSGIPKSPTAMAQVSSLTAALAAVTVEQQQQRLLQVQQQHPM
ncbi:hypothetical protein BGW38_000486 [Lunasporangiospora selenospora]|uniref:C2H2-type domain-containing protein n=1 Tax=Lunasporangiospora selenospora TaxID=979761 RepID=A0A9P6FUS6_9FUNG|nr:hypothetical protein BGW38_000486 [Lunasporangiospora selenospora]